MGMFSNLLRLATSSLRSSRKRCERPGRRNLRRKLFALEQLEPRNLLSAAPQLPAGWQAKPLAEFLRPSFVGSASPTALTPNQIRGAYGLGGYVSTSLSNGVTFNGTPGDGRGQTIAIVDAYDDPNAASDLNAFSSAFGLPSFGAGTGSPTFTKLNQNGGTSLPPTDPAGSYQTTGSEDSWELEESLDIEWAHAVAPLANIILIEASNAGSGLFQGVATAAGLAGVSVVSMSWGGSEFSNEATFDAQYFVTPAGHVGGSAPGGSGIVGGVTFLAASGDSGTYASGTGAAAAYPASSPNVVAIGGTTLAVSGSDPDYSYGSETAWSGSGGGISEYESQPLYQRTAAASFSATKRTFPDVAANADPNSGVPVYDSWDFGASTPWSPVELGGTSLACPIWAGIIAVADEGRAIAGQGSLDGPGQTLPELYNLPTSDFHDITSGTNAGSYDLATGLGSAVGNLLVPVLASGASTASIPAITGLSPASGPVAGGTQVTITGLDLSGATTVNFGTTPALSFVVNSSTEITAICPAGTVGSVDVTVTTSGGTSAATSSDKFTYVNTIGQQIIDNSQPGFWSTSSSTWTTTTSGLGGSSLISSTPNGSEQSQAAWWFSMPAGMYEISITYTAGSNLTKDMGLDLYDGVDDWIGQIPVNEQVAPHSFTEDGVAWENLGAFNLTSNIFHISTWNSSTDGAISVNGIQLQSVAVIDAANTPTSYPHYPSSYSVGSFTANSYWTASTQGAYGASQTSSSRVGSGLSMATWTMPVTPGSYEVDVTWPPSASLSASATYNIYDGGTKLKSVTVNQQATPSGVNYEGVKWQSLGSYPIQGTQLIVTLSNTGGYQQVSANAIRILPAYQPMAIADAASSGFWSNSGGWTTQNTGLYGQSLVSSSANGSEQSQAAWWFPVQPGQYDVEVSWVPGSNLSSTVPFDVYNAQTFSSESLVNEQVAPAGITDQGVVWQSLGVFTMTSDVLHVSTWNSQANGAICVDGIRIVPVGT